MTDRELLQQVLDAWQDHWVNDHQSALLETIRANCANCARCGEKNPAEIHTCTPQREWHGLTYEEIKDILDCGRPNLVNIKKAEQKLKEKNA